MKILVTGAKGFVGKNLISELKNQGFTDIVEFDKENDEHKLYEHAKDCEFVFHLAGVNRPKTEIEFEQGNTSFTLKLLEALKINRNCCPVLISSSIQAELDNPYGKSKKAAEELLLQYGKDTGASVYIFRLQNVFGKWCRPNYNSVVATFCNNIACGLPIQINNTDTELNLVYIDDVVNEFINAMIGTAQSSNGYYSITRRYSVKLGELADLIGSFRRTREDLSLPDLSDDFVRKLYSTYLSYLPEDEFSYPLIMNIDARGSFTEIIRTKDRGQISVNITKPGVTKGNHWHHTKCEKFLVVSGTGVIRFRRIDLDQVIEYKVSGEKMEVVDIPPGYTHNIANMGEGDLVTMMWVNEPYDPANPDTYYLGV